MQSFNKQNVIRWCGLEANIIISINKEFIYNSVDFQSNRGAF